MPNPLDWLDRALEHLEDAGLRRTARVRFSPQSAAQVEIDDRTLLNFGSNDYLGFASEPFLRDAAIRAIEHSGWGSGASPLLGGRSLEHEALERETAAFEGAEECLLFPTGYAANVGAIAALVGRNDLVFSDARNHASIIDGCRLSRAEVCVYEHNNVAELDQRLQAADPKAKKLIVTDSLFSMDGDAAPLAALADVSKKHNVMLMVDEAHATGVFGAGGRGLCEHLGVHDAVDVRVGTYSKALGSHGGFITGRRTLIEWLRNRARPYFFSTAGPPAVAAASRAALAEVQMQPHRRRELLAKASWLRNQLASLGWQTGNACGQIIPLHVGSDDRAVRLSRRLWEEGIFAPGIRPPTVPPGQALIRLSLSFAHSQANLEQLLESLAEASSEIDQST